MESEEARNANSRGEIEGRPIGVVLIMAVHAVSALGILALWPLMSSGLIPVPASQFPDSYAWAFGDYFIALPLNVIAIPGLWAMRRWGVWATLLWCGAVLYGTPVIATLAVLRGITPLTWIELPAYPAFLIGLGIIFYLYKRRDQFS